VQLGYVFDNNNTTPMILKRADITRSIRLYTTANGTGNEDYVDYGRLKVGDSITLYPKYYDSTNASG
jgi:hypothetical protein